MDMPWSFDEARQCVLDLLGTTTYAKLQEQKKTFESKGITIPNDFILTENRQKVLIQIKEQFSTIKAPTAIMTGYFGSGKTAILTQLIRDLSDGQLCYGSLKVDPIEISLNEWETLSKFLGKLFFEISNLIDEDWILEVYKREHSGIPLPDLVDTSVKGLTTTLVGMHITQIHEVHQFLEEIFKAYKKAMNNERIIGLICDELENVTRTAELGVSDGQGKVDDKSKLSELLRSLLDFSVRENITKDSLRRDPYVIVIFSIPERTELQKGGWLFPDTDQRCESVEQNINLTPEAVEYLMKKILRLYLIHVIEVAASDTTDPWLKKWLAQLNSANKVEDDLYTYPIMPDVHQQMSYHILEKSTVGTIIDFRAYQVALRVLLSEWEGQRPIDMRFAMDKESVLSDYLRNYKVNLGNIVGEEHVHKLVEKRFKQLRPGSQYQLGRITMATITQGKLEPMAMFRYKDLPILLGGKIPTENAFDELCKKIDIADVDGWSVTGDMLCIDISTILRCLAETEKEISPDIKLQELLRTTEASRKDSSVIQLLYQQIRNIADIADIESYIDGDKVLHIKDNTSRGQLIDEFLIAFDDEKDTLKKKVDAKLGCCIGVLFNKGQATSESGEIPFSVTVVLPTALQNAESKYSNKVLSKFSPVETWERRIQPLMDAVVQREHCDYYTAFNEAIKLMLLLPKHPDRLAYKLYEWDVAKTLLDSLSLEPTERNIWLTTKLNFEQFHNPTNNWKMIKVLSSDLGEKLTYNSSDDLNPKLNKKFNVPMDPPAIWKQQLKEEWAKEDFVSDDRLIPFDNWSEERKKLYRNVDKALEGKTLTFTQIGKILFGDCQFRTLDTANAFVHLFLKLGRTRPFYWMLSDDVDDYRSMKITPGALFQKAELQKAQLLGNDLIRNLIIATYTLSPDKYQSFTATFKWILERTVKLINETNIGVIQQVKSDFEHYSPPSIREKVIIPQELISKCPGDLAKLGEFLTKINEIIRSRSILSYIVSAKVSTLIPELAGELTCESILRKIQKLFSNWNQSCPTELNPDRLSVKISTDYSNKIGKTISWEKTLIEEVDKKFNSMASKLTLERTEWEVVNICNWLNEQACSVIYPEWSGTYSDEDKAKFPLILQEAETTAKKEISQIEKNLKRTLEQISTEQGQLISPKYRHTIAEHRSRLNQDVNTISQLPNQLYVNPFAKTMELVNTHIKEWQNFYTSIFTDQEDKIKSWLKKHDLENHSDAIREVMSRVIDMSITEFDRELREQGVDPLKLLQGTEATRILEVFAAVQLLDFLRMEGTDDSNRKNAS